MQSPAKQIFDHLTLRAQRVVIIPHQHPDGDALGSATALAEFLVGQKTEHAIFCATPAAPKFDYLEHAHKLSTDPVILKNADTIILVDSGDLRYAGVAEHLKGHPATIINFDHHATNEQFGHFNFVSTAAASTTEMIYKFFTHNHVRINHHMANSLLTGLITDTDNFTNAATSASAVTAAAELLRSGANLKLINNANLRNKTVPILKLWAVALSRLNLLPEKNMAYTYITQADLHEYNVLDNETEGIANFLNNVEGIDIALILKETSEGTVKGSFRTTHDTTDVSLLAKALGGGGHKKAAGFSVTGTIAEALQHILTIMK